MSNISNAFSSVKNYIIPYVESNRLHEIKTDENYNKNEKFISNKFITPRGAREV